ncbi:winged helix-turn-helix domain-containing protein [Halorubellus sp. PRR65]|uniref:winged helix-turn-helix domain-containing protein n=1 Tax=Halorubellus sp. PRR65 TaxID=3098148 RepID=UPI002B25C5DD|nr:winged helix-turn-helix domain-containing protein [Halorubellus sp. PRR65]
MAEDTDRVSDAFAALGDDTRVAILEALVDARRETPDDPGLSFSGLRERVGVEDSGRFNYHLGKLRGRFTTVEDGEYSLTEAGNEVVGGILAGTYDDALDLDPTPLDEACPLCGAAAVAHFGDGQLRVECEADHPLLVTALPPAAASDRSTAEIVDFAVRKTYAQLDLVTAGICSECYGHVQSEIRPVEADDDAIPSFAYHTECTRCGYVTGSVAAVAALRDAAFVAFCHEHGVTVGDRLPWTLPGIVDDDTTAVSEDPSRYETSFELDGDRLVVTLDDRGEVVDTARE